jgi:hypothetical protein
MSRLIFNFNGRTEPKAAGQAIGAHRRMNSWAFCYGHSREGLAFW